MIHVSESLNKCYLLQKILLCRPTRAWLEARVQEVNGSPVNPVGQRHTVTWLRTSHSASTPQDVEHGLMHWKLWHTLFEGHSAFSIQW